MRRIFVGLVLAALVACSARISAAVIISEFLAENDGGLHDQNGETPDWIELFNSSGAPVNLDGWHLTDNPTNVTKWTFPPTNLAANSFLIVFASGKNRATNGAELHTNFQLDNNGGYLALVDSNGVVVSEFNYPQQHRNVSYGPGLSNAPTVTLLASGDAARWFVPVDGSLGSSWTAVGFNSSTWSNAPTPLRYDVGTSGTNGSPVLSIDINQRTNTAANTQAGFQPFLITSNTSATSIQTTPTTRTYGGISVTLSNSNPSVGYDDRVRNTPTDNGSLTTSALFRDFVFSRETTGSTNGLDIFISGLAASQQYDITIWSFDSGSTGSRISDWYANGILVTNDYTFNGSTLPTSNSDDRFTFRATASGSGGILVSGRRDLAANTFGVFINAMQIAPVTVVAATNGNVAAMSGVNSTLFERQTFNVTSPSSFAQLTLRVKYNDGFVAYLNGTEVARRNASSTPDWNSAATASHPAATNEDIILSGATALLITGTNMLAIQGLNVSAGDADFYLEPQLIGTLFPVTNGFFSPPTPATSNGTAFYGVVADTKFSVDRGFYDTPFSLSITSATAGASIYFTTNGNAPSPTNGFAFTSPISLTGNSFIRAAAYLPGWISSGIDTHSYIFLRDVLRQSNNIPGYPTTWPSSSGLYTADYGMDSNIVNHPLYGLEISNDLRSISTLAIVSDQNGLWDATTGILPNPQSIGPAWERAASLELIRGSDSHTEFAVTAKIQVHGNASRDNLRTPKHSIGVSFNNDYGPTKLNYDWFGGGVDTHDGIVLRSCGFVDGWAGRYADSGTYTSSETGETFRGLRYRPENTCYLRDSWMKDSFRAMGWSASRSTYVHLYINGLYWGLYEPSEHLGASYFQLLYGGDEGAWDVVVGEDNNGPPVLVDGSLTDWNSVLALANAGVANESQYQAIANLIDIDNLIDYMMLHIFGESEDWPRHNWYVAHRRATNGVPATKFICSVWDQELTLDRLVRRNRIDVGNGTDGAGELYSPARIYAQLRNWPEFRRQFGDRVQKHLFNGGALTPSNNVSRFLASASVISNAVVGESARWGDARKVGVPAGQTGTGQTFTRDEWWKPEIDKTTTNFFQHLTADNVTRFRAGNLYPLLGAPNFNQFGGAVSNGFAIVMTHTNTSGTIYFTSDQSDPRVYGSGAVAATAQAYSMPIPVNTPTLVRARVFDGANWSALVEAVFFPPQDFSKLALTEIMYHPPDVGATDGDEYEFVELKNFGTNTLNLSGLNLDGIAFTFTNGTLLAPGAYCVLVRNATAFASKYPGIPIKGIYSGKLSNSGERLTLFQALGGNAIFSITYQTAAPWPIAPDGAGFSLVPVNPGLTQAPDDGHKWRASAMIGGSPGADDPTPGVAPILINEILTHTTFPALDRIELFNPTATNVDIGGWFLSDAETVPKRYRIPNGTIISAGNYLTLDETQFNATPGSNSFSLSGQGEEVYLSSGDGTNLTGWSHGFAFDAAAEGESFGRYIDSVGEEQFPAQISNTFGAPNSGPRVGPVVINEIHYHPATNGDEFLELKNISPTNVMLFDPARPTNRWDVNGVAFTFPPNITLPPGGLALITATNPLVFIAKFSVPTNVPVFAYSGTMQHDGEQIEVRRPDVPDTNRVPYVAVDVVRYNNKAPWPAAANGSGLSLQRKFANQYGNDPINWQAAAPTPGRDNAEADSDGDGMPDAWEIANGTNMNVPDASDDPDGDGYSNYQEYLAGTNPHDAQSRLKVEHVTASGGGVQFDFTATSNRTFTVQFKDSLGALSWSVLTNISAAPQTRVINITVPPTNTARFFRLGAP